MRVARIYTPHGGSLHYDRRGLKNRVYFAAERWLGRRTDGFIFVSRYEAYAFSDKVHKPRVVSDVVPNGLRPEEYEPIVPAPNARPFVFIGMMRDLKGPDVVIKALAQLKAVGLPVAAHMIGSGPDRDTYRDMVAALGLSDVITFHDPIVARDAFPMGKVLIVPSRAESMPYIVLEAAAAGVPMIATKVGGIPEIFDEQWKRLIEPGDVEALASAMEATLTDPQPLLDATAALREEVRQLHTVEVMATSIEALYRAALSAIPRR
jgi:glycosyltransferase involved in cell wall biosynthesis